MLLCTAAKFPTYFGGFFPPELHLQTTGETDGSNKQKTAANLAFSRREQFVCHGFIFSIISISLVFCSTVVQRKICTFVILSHQQLSHFRKQSLIWTYRTLYKDVHLFFVYSPWIQEFTRNLVQFLPDIGFQLLKSLWSSLTYFSFNDVPNVLYRWKIWTAARPIQHPDTTTKPCCCNSCSMWFCIVLLK